MNQEFVIPTWLKKKKFIVSVIIVILLIAIVVSGAFIVDQTEEAVVLRLGKYHRTVGPGLHLKLPLRIDQNFNVPTQLIQNMSFGFRTERPGVTTLFSNVDYPEESIMLTGDLNIVDVEWIIQYRISNPRDWLFHVDDQPKTIRDVSQSVVNLLIGDRAIIDVMGDERTPIEIQALELMNNIFNSFELGITITAVRLQNIVPPVGRVQDAFEDVNRAVQDMNRLINEGREAYNRDIPRARGEAEQLIQISQGYAAERVNTAGGDAERFRVVLGEYLRAPGTTRTRLYYEMIENVLNDPERTQFVDRSLDALPLLNITRSERILQEAQ